MSPRRSTTALIHQNRRANADGTHVADSASNTALHRRLSATFAHKKIAANATRPQFAEHDVDTERLATDRAAFAKSLVFLTLFGLVSAIVLIYKYLLLAFVYVMARLHPAEFDRDSVIDALNEIEKESA